MARFRRARAAWSNRKAYYGRARGYAKRAYGKTGLTITPSFMAGFGAAFVVPDNPMLDAGSIVVSTFPIRGKGKFEQLAKGYLLGQLTQQFILPKLGINFGNIMGGNQPRFSNIV